MRLVNLENIGTEHRLAKNIYDENGHILLASGNPIKPEYVARLKKMGIASIYVEDDIVGKLEVDEIVSEGVRLQVKKLTREALARVKAGHAPETKALKGAINDVMDEVIRNRHMLIHLTDIRSSNDRVFSHSVNVCILSLLTAVALGYNQLRLKELGIGALLHDVGKAMLPEKSTKSPDQLTAVEKIQLQKHADTGFEILRKTEEISAVAAHVAWQHHERFDGAGYPRGLRGQEIHEYARIVAVADMYDNLATGHLAQPKRLLPHEIIEILQECQGREFDPEIVKTFIHNIAPFPVGCLVRLSNGQRGVVTEARKALPTRPKVKILFDQQGNPLFEQFTVDLTEELTLFISEVISE